MLAIINEILTFKDRQIRASARLTIAKGTVHRAYGVRAMRSGDGLTGAPRRSSLEARGGERSACSTPSPTPRAQSSMADIRCFRNNISIAKI